MKDLKETILEKLYYQQVNEKLVFNKHTKSKLLVDIKGETCFTQQEIDEIRDFAQSLKIKPIIITNQYVGTISGLSFDENVLFIYFYDEWKKIVPYDKAQDIKNEKEQILAIRFEKIIHINIKYYYNVLYNTKDWIYTSRDPVNSCKVAIANIKNDLNEEILENKFSQNKIFEKLVFNKHTKEKHIDKKSVADIDIPWRVSAHFNIYNRKQKINCMNKMVAYYTKKSKVRTLINTIKDSTKLVNRWYCAVLLEWDEAIQKFGEEIENRNIATVDQLSAHLYMYYIKPQTSLAIYAREYGQDGDINTYKKHLEHYFDLYNIEY